MIARDCTCEAFRCCSSERVTQSRVEAAGLGLQGTSFGCFWSFDSLRLGLGSEDLSLRTNHSSDLAADPFAVLSFIKGRGVENLFSRAASTAPMPLKTVNGRNTLPTHTLHHKLPGDLVMQTPTSDDLQTCLTLWRPCVEGSEAKEAPGHRDAAAVALEAVQAERHLTGSGRVGEHKTASPPCISALL